MSWKAHTLYPIFDGVWVFVLCRLQKSKHLLLGIVGMQSWHAESTHTDIVIPSHTESYPHIHWISTVSHSSKLLQFLFRVIAPLKSRDLVPQTLNVFRTYGALWEVFHRTMATERTHAETYSGCPHVLCSSGFLALRPRKHQKLKPGEFCARPFNFHILNWSPAFNCVCSLSPIATLKSADFVLLRFWRKLRTLRR